MVQLEDYLFGQLRGSRHILPVLFFFFRGGGGGGGVWKEGGNSVD
jgi:hypothetical protein